MFDLNAHMPTIPTHGVGFKNEWAKELHWRTLNYWQLAQAFNGHQKIPNLNVERALQAAEYVCSHSRVERPLRKQTEELLHLLILRKGRDHIKGVVIHRDFRKKFMVDLTKVEITNQG